MSNNTLPKLRGRIVERYGTLRNFAAELGLSAVAVSNKVNGSAGFSKEDIIKWSELLDIPAEEVGESFFALKK